MLDIILENALIIDGSGQPRFPADLGIKNKQIVQIGKIDSDATQRIDLNGCILCPGFIDMHGHSDLEIIKNSALEHKIRQGITTEVIGQDGLSVSPLKSGKESLVRDNIAPLAGEMSEPWNWASFSSYLERLEKSALNINIASLVGHATVRTAVMDLSRSVPTMDQIGSMKSLVGEALEAGAFGMSVGLIYPPSSFADTAELIELAKVVHRYDGVFVAHMRDEMSHLLDSVDEMLSIARASGVKIHISHLKSLGPRNWGKVDQVLDMIDAANDQGLRITFDHYPYEAGCTGLKACIPDWAYEGGLAGLRQRLRDPSERKKIVQRADEIIDERGGAGRIVIASIGSEKNQGFVSKSLQDISEQLGLGPGETVVQLLDEENASVLAIYFAISMDDIRRIIKHPAHTVCTDGIVASHPHPRTYGTFPRVISRFVIEEGILTLEQAIAHMTGCAASVYGFKNRGLLAVGRPADLVAFDPKLIKDKATYDYPKQFPQGIHFVLVNGAVALDRDTHYSPNTGKLLRREV